MIPKPNAGLRASFWASCLAFALLSVATGTLLLHPLDRWILAVSQTRASAALDGVGAVFSVLGDVEYVGPAFLVMLVALYVSGRRRLSRRLLIALLATGFVEIAMKYLVPAPPMPLATARSSDAHPIVAIEPPYPYPSGHMLRFTLLLGALYILWPNRLARGAALVLLLGMGATRIYLGVHWATDVIGGALLGAAGIAWAFGGRERQQKTRNP